MNVPAVTGGSNPTGGTSGAAAAKTANPSALGQGAFMQLLVAELKYQNPMQPSNPTAFIGELAQFQTLSSMTALQKDMQAQSQAAQMQEAVGLVGHKVQYLAGTRHGSGTVQRVVVRSGVPAIVVGKTTVALSDVTSVDS